jgi:hypothetical protein
MSPNSPPTSYDASEPDPRDFYPAFADAVKDDLDAPGMERYDEEVHPGSSRETSARPGCANHGS